MHSASPRSDTICYDGNFRKLPRQAPALKSFCMRGMFANSSGPPCPKITFLAGRTFANSPDITEIGGIGGNPSWLFFCCSPCLCLCSLCLCLCLYLSAVFLCHVLCLCLCLFSGKEHKKSSNQGGRGTKISQTTIHMARVRCFFAAFPIRDDKRLA